MGPSWFLEGVEIAEEGEGEREEGGRTTRFPCGQWLEECEGCGGDLGVELVPEGMEGSRRKEVKGE